MTTAIVPTYLRDDRDKALTIRCLRSMRRTAPDLSGIMVDDGSPNGDALSEVAYEAQQLGYGRIYMPENGGFAKTVNAGIRTAGQDDVVLVNADIEFIEDGWLERMQQSSGDVVGGLLLFPEGVIQHAGVYFSMVARKFHHRFSRAPYNFAPALEPIDCPVTAALQLIRRETIERVGLYDESFKLGLEDVDYCLRVFKSGRRCRYEPTVRAYHHEGQFRVLGASQKHTDWQWESGERLKAKHADVNFMDCMPTMWVEHVYA